jgi:hypothetical protein
MSMRVLGLLGCLNDLIVFFCAVLLCAVLLCDVWCVLCCCVLYNVLCACAALLRISTEMQE